LSTDIAVISVSHCCEQILLWLVCHIVVNRYCCD